MIDSQYPIEVQYERIAIQNWRSITDKPQGIAVIFDVFRCSTTVQTLLNQKDRDFVLVSKDLNHLKTLCGEFSIFSELPAKLNCASRFDNSPAKAAEFNESNSCLVSTTSGTPAMFAAKFFQKVLVGSLANFSALVKELAAESGKITLLPAADPSGNHVEDSIVAEQIAIAIDGFSDDENFVSACADQARVKIEASGRIEHLTEKLPTGADDMQICLDIDRYDFVPRLDFEPWCNLPGLARVYR